MLFKSFNNNHLELILDAQFKLMFTDVIKSSITTELITLLGNITLNITIAKINNTPAQKQKNIQQIQDKTMKSKFLDDKSLQKLEKIFSSKIDINTIKRR